MKCCICKNEIEVNHFGWAHGHNAEPAKDGRCCTACNELVVIPLRLAQYGLVGYATPEPKEEDSDER